MSNQINNKMMIKIRQGRDYLQNIIMKGKNERLFKAIMEDDDKVMQALIDEGCDVNSVNPQSSNNALMEALFFQSLKCAEIIVNSNVDVMYQSNRGSTALDYAVAQHHVEMVKKLIDKGADVNHQDVHGYSTMMNLLIGHEVASRFDGGESHAQDLNKRLNEIIDMMIEHDADLLLESEDGKTVLDLVDQDTAVFQKLKDYYDQQAGLSLSIR